MSEKEHVHIVPGPDGQPLLEREENGETTYSRISPLADGRPLRPGQEIADVQRVGGNCYTLETLYRNGPPKVTTPAYRSGWDALWGHSSEASN